MSGVVDYRYEITPTPSNYDLQQTHAHFIARSRTKEQVKAYWQRRQLRVELGRRLNKMKITLPKIGGA